MITQESVLVQLVRLVERVPTPPPPPPRPGRPHVYSDGLFLKALTIMIVRRIHRVGELLAILEEPTQEMRALRELLTEHGRFPTRRTFERRLRALPEMLPERIGVLGRHLVGRLKPWARTGRAVALDSTVLFAKGGVWHKKDREAGIVPHSSIDTEAAWTKSGWHGWAYGWKLHLGTTVGSVWIPLSAYLTPANVSDNLVALSLIEQLPEEARFVLGDTHYNAPEVRAGCLEREKFLVASGRGPYPHTDPGVWKLDASSTGCATPPSRTSTSTSRPSSIATKRCRPKASATPRASRWGRCSSTSWHCFTATDGIRISTAGSKLSSEPPEQL
jgi:hypothetical protein